MMNRKKTELPDIHPSIVKKPLCRLRRNRKKNSDEPQNPHKLSRAGGNVLCGNYHKTGHNIRGCKVAITEETPWQRRVRIQKAKEAGTFIPNRVYVIFPHYLETFVY